MMNFLVPVEHFQCDRVDLADVAAIAKHVNRAVATYGTPALKEMIQNCMALDLSWKVSISLKYTTLSSFLFIALKCKCTRVGV